jgi:hypothetical protein
MIGLMSGFTILLSGLMLTPAARAIQGIPSHPTSAPHTSIASAAIDTVPTRSISPTFMGLSHEWIQSQAMMGTSATGTNQIYRQLLRNLTAYGSGPIIVRIGGNSTDQNVDLATISIVPFSELFTALGVHFYFGVNLGSNDPNFAASEAQAWTSQMPSHSIDAIEIGNEPENYPGHGMRPLSYSFTDYLGDFNTWTRAILSTLPPHFGIMGPAWGYAPTLKNLSSFEKQNKSNLIVLSQHYYPGTVCGGVNNPIDFLLIPGASTSGPNTVSQYVQITHSNGMLFRMGETNSISCGGQNGISNTFSSALWAIDTMFEYAKIGVDGINWHTGNGGFYSTFQFTTKTGPEGLTEYGLRTVSPLYYGLLFFQEATGNRAELLPVSLTAIANVKIWATIDANKTVRVTIINKDERVAGKVSLSLNGYHEATVTRLSATSYRAMTGITIAGQTFDGSVDGRLIGNRTSELLQPTSTGTYGLNMPITSAALLKFVK